MNTESYTLGNSFKRKKYLRYDGGGAIDPNTANAVVGSSSQGTKGAGFSNAMSLAPMATGILDAFDGGNEFGRQSTGVSTAKGALAGAQAGMALGPIGAGVGALVGGAVSFFGSKSAEKAEKAYNFQRDARKKQTDANYMQSKLCADPSLYQGNLKAQYFETGGTLSGNYLANQKALGGNVNQQSSDGVEFNGQSHNEGGIKLPNVGAEVEGGETAKGDYVFSDVLGFAKLHKPIMTAKGKIESKPYTIERKNSINLLNQQEEKLKTLQEQFKQQLNLQ